MISQLLFLLLGIVIGMFIMAIIIIKQPMLLMSMVSGEFSKDIIKNFGKK